MSYTPSQLAEKTAFLTTTPLASGATFSSGMLNANGYSQVQTEILSDVAGTINIYFCSDEAGADVVRTLSIPYVAGSGYQFFSAPAFVNYIKYDFINGSTAQSDFYYTTKFLSTSLSPQILTTNGFISPSMTSQLNRSIIVGTDLAGNFRNVGTDEDGHLKMRITDPLTAFGDLKISEMTPVLQVTHPYEINYNVVSSGQTTGSGSLTYNSGTTLVSVNSGAASSSKGVMTSKRLAKYRNGQGLSVRFTAIFDTPVSGNEQWAGWGDSLDGFFFGYSGTTFGILRRNSSSGDAFMSQTSWNSDKMDGTKNSSNPSGQLLNPQKGNVFEIQVQWLGFGAIKFKIEDSESGEFQDVHRIKYANTYTTPSTINPTFPVRFESNNTSNTSNVVIKNASFAAFNEGVVEYTGPRFSFSNTKATTTDTAIFVLDNPSTYKGKTNRTRILLKTFSYFTDQSNGAAVDFKIVRDGTLAGTSFTNINIYSPIQQSTAGTYTSGSGNVLFTASLPKVDAGVVNLTDSGIFLNPGETLTIVGNGSNVGSGAALTWVEDI